MKTETILAAIGERLNKQVTLDEVDQLTQRAVEHLDLLTLRALIELSELREDNFELNRLFELRRYADQRAVQRWRTKNPDKKTILSPDHADLVLFLIEKLEETREASFVTAGHQGWKRDPANVEAVLWTGNNYDEVYKWVMGWDLVDPGIDHRGDRLRISCNEVEIAVPTGDMIVRDLAGGFFYPMTVDLFGKLCTPNNALDK